MRDYRVRAAFVIFLIVAAMAMAAVALHAVINPPPIAGYISSKNAHPQYFPVDQNTPTVYCLGITSHDKHQACSWYVSEKVFNSYNIGDIAGQPTNLPQSTSEETQLYVR